MDADHSRAIGDAVKILNRTIGRYLENPSDRSAKIEALRDAKNLVKELQDGDDAFFARIEHVSLRNKSFNG